MKETNLVLFLKKRFNFIVFPTLGFIVLFSVSIYLHLVSSNLNDIRLKTLVQVADLLQEPLRTQDLIAVQNIVKGFKIWNSKLKICVLLNENVSITGSTCNSEYFPFKVSITDKTFKIAVDVLDDSREYTLTLAFILLLVLIVLFTFRILMKTSQLISSDISMLLNNSNNNKSFYFSDIEDVKIKLNEKLTLEKEIEKSKLATQLAHDIRSPLEALRSIVNDLGSVSFNSKQIILGSIHRISEIANDLLLTSKKDDSQLINILILLNELVESKYLERQIKIIIDSDLCYTDSFLMGKEEQLYRAFSNLINNAIESGVSTQSSVSIKLRKDFQQNKIKVFISDNGRGMSPEQINKATSGNFTTKNNGNGIGLSSSLKLIRNNNGDLIISSTPGFGTTIEITFESAPKQSAYLAKINLDQNDKILCIDDDESFLNLYKMHLAQKNLNFTTLNPNDNLASIEFNNYSMIFCDLDFNNEFSGIDLIEKQNIAHNTIFTTSHYNDLQLIEFCNKYNSHILPKQLFTRTEITTSNNNEANTSCILIDDDELIRLSWERKAGSSKFNLLTFESVDSFLQKSFNFSKNLTIFIDSDLGKGIKGEIESKKIFEAGFENIILATGYSPDDIDKPIWIKKIVGKSPRIIEEFA